MEIIREGETVDAIIQMVLLEQGWTSEEVTIEIVQQEKKGWFRAQPAIVKIKQKPLHVRADVHQWNDGECKEWIYFTRGQLYVMPPFPVESVVIHPDESNQLQIGNRPLLMPEPFPNYPVTIHRREIAFQEQIEIQISPDDLIVSIRLSENGGYQLIPKADFRKQQLHISFQNVRKLEETIQESNIVDCLKSNGVTFGIREERIHYWMNQPALWDQWYPIAEGRAMTPGKSTEFILKSKPQIIRAAANETQSKEAVNYYGFSNIHTVKDGDQLLEIRPRTNGFSGMTVKGEEIPVSEGSEIVPMLGENVKLSEDGRFVVSTVEGVLEYDMPKISVKPMYVINGDVDLKTGSIQFKGSVLVNGNVREGMTIIASDHVQVTGTVTDATVYAGKTVEIRGNVVMSKVMAGLQYANLMQRYFWTRQMNDMLIQIVADGHHKRSKVNLDQRHAFVQKWIGDTQTIWYNGTKLPWEERNTRWYQVAHSACTGHTVANTTEEWMLEEGMELEHMILNLIGKESVIRIYNAHLSSLYAAGDVVFLGKGSYLSTICASNKVFALEGDGFVRGGNLLAGESIQVKTLGSPAGAQTVCTLTSAGGSMDIGQLNPGVETTIGKTRKIHNDRLINCKLAFQPSTNRIEMAGK